MLEQVFPRPAFNFITKARVFPWPFSLRSHGKVAGTKVPATFELKMDMRGVDSFQRDQDLPFLCPPSFLAEEFGAEE